MAYKFGRRFSQEVSNLVVLGWVEVPNKPTDVE